MREHVNYYVRSWISHYSKDIEVLESVQRRAKQLVKALENKHMRIS